AILARARGVPLLVGMGFAPESILDGAPAILDASQGRLIQDPASETATRFGRLIEARGSAARALADYLPRPAITRSGARILVHVNADDPRILSSVDPAHCDGIGLTRTEFLFHGAATLPDEDVQLAAYSHLLEWAAGRRGSGGGGGGPARQDPRARCGGGQADPRLDAGGRIESLPRIAWRAAVAGPAGGISRPTARPGARRRGGNAEGHAADGDRAAGGGGGPAHVRRSGRGAVERGEGRAHAGPRHDGRGGGCSDQCRGVRRRG